MESSAESVQLHDAVAVLCKLVPLPAADVVGFQVAEPAMRSRHLAKAPSTGSCRASLPTDCTRAGAPRHRGAVAPEQPQGKALSIF